MPYYKRYQSQCVATHCARPEKNTVRGCFLRFSAYNKFFSPGFILFNSGFCSYSSNNAIKTVFFFSKLMPSWLVLANFERQTHAEQHINGKN